MPLSVRLGPVCAFLALCGVFGGALGASVKAFWELRWRAWSPTSSSSALHAGFHDLQDATFICMGILLVVVLCRSLLRRGTGRRPRPDRSVRSEAALLAVVFGGCLVWGSRSTGWVHAGTAGVQALVLRFCLLAVHSSLGIVVREIPSSEALRLGWRAALPTGVWLTVYLAGRAAFTWVFMWGLQLRVENGLYLIVPLGAALLEAIVLVATASTMLVLARRRA